MLEIKALSFTYPGEEKPALNNINLKINDGEFAVIYGKSGCSKTTLLKHLKPEMTPHGEFHGEIYIDGENINDIAGARSAKKIAYVPQTTYNSLAAHTVYKELAFSLECVGMSDSDIYLRTAECSEYFGIGDLFESATDELSGGEQKLVLIAAAVCLDPDIIVLDEPLSQLDPISCRRIISVLHRLNTEKGVTVIMSEHTLEDIYPICSRVISMNNGEIIYDGAPSLKSNAALVKNSVTGGLPSYIRLYDLLGNRFNCPGNIAQARKALSELKLSDVSHNMPDLTKKRVAVQCKNLSFKYTKKGRIILNDLSFILREGEITGLLGSNGSGKSTLIKLLSGVLGTYEGSIKLFSKDKKRIKDNVLYSGLIGYLPQNPVFIFAHEKVNDDFDEIARCHSVSDEKRHKIEHDFNVSHLLDRNPRDLSAGELQKCAVCAVMLTSPKILFLDEPCKGLDADAKQSIKRLLIKLKESGTAILIVTHDAEFAADVCDTCAMLFGGELIGKSDKYTFFLNNKFYTTPMRRITDGIINGCICDEDIKAAGAAYE